MPMLHYTVDNSFLFSLVMCLNMSAFIMLFQQTSRSAEMHLKVNLPDAKGVAAMGLLKVFICMQEHC